MQKLAQRTEEQRNSKTSVLMKQIEIRDIKPRRDFCGGIKKKNSFSLTEELANSVKQRFV